MGFVDKQHHRFDTGVYFIDHRTQALFELAFHAGARLQQTNVKGEQLHVFQAGRYIATGDALGKPFSYGSLAHARLAHQDRVVLAAAHEDVDHLADLWITADDGVHLTVARLLSEVDSEAFQRCLLVCGSQCPEVFARHLMPVTCLHQRFGRAVEQGVELLAQVIDADLVELTGHAIQTITQGRGFQHCQQ